jgi:hypothetical protein
MSNRRNKLRFFSALEQTELFLPLLVVLRLVRGARNNHYIISNGMHWSSMIVDYWKFHPHRKRLPVHLIEFWRVNFSAYAAGLCIDDAND